MATNAQPQPADFNISLDLIQAGMGFAVSITVEDGKGLTTRLILQAQAAESLARAILAAVEQSKSKLVSPN
jgi:hypothetical protein